MLVIADKQGDSRKEIGVELDPTAQRALRSKDHSCQGDFQKGNITFRIRMSGVC
jgi:hypothetical protein